MIHKKVKRYFFAVAINCLLGIEKKILTKISDQPIASVFIIGPPRSGTTLLYQLLVSRYKFVYFSNFTAKFYPVPVIATWLAERFLVAHNPISNYNSKYGRTEGLSSPHEAGNFWYRWFPKGEKIYVPLGITPKDSLRELRHTVIGMANVAHAPVLFKNTYNSMRIAPIVEAIPESCFIVCRRNPTDTAQSILNSRLKAAGDKHKWWSLSPKELDQIKQHPYWEQVVEQVYYTYSQIEIDRDFFGREKFFDLSYESLCQDTYGTLTLLEEYLTQRGINLSLNEKNNEIPSQFSCSTGQKVSDEDFFRIQQKVKALWG